MQKSKTFGNLILLVTSIIWGIAFVFQRSGMDSIEPITFNAARMTCGAIFVTLISFFLDTKRKVNRQSTDTKQPSRIKSTILAGVICGVLLTAASTVQQIGLVHTSAGKAGFITAMYMLFVPIFNFLIFKEKGSAKIWIAIALGIAGMYLLCMNEGIAFTDGDLLILICALLFSGHILCCDKFAKNCDPVKISAIQFITASVLSSILALLTEVPSIDKVLSAAVPILYCGLISGGIGYTLQIVGQKYTDPSSASLLMSLESVFALIAGVLMLGEKMTPRELIGCAIMFIAIILVQLPNIKKTTPKQ